MGALLILIAAVTWGTTGTTMKLVEAGSSVSPLLVGVLRVTIAAPCLCLAVWAMGGRLRLPPAPERGRLVAAGLAMAGYQVCYFRGVARTSVAVGSLVAICSAPLFITVAAAVFLGERTGPRTWGALIAGVVGAGLLTVGPHGLGPPPPGFLGGVGLALLAGLAYATYAVLVKGAVARVEPQAVAALSFSVSALALAPFLLTERLTATPTGWLLLVYLGVVPTALAYVLYAVGLRTTRVTVSGVLTLLEPLTAVLLGLFLFGERLGALGALGVVLLLGAVAGLTIRAR